MAEERTNRPAPEDDGHIDLANYDLELLGPEVLAQFDAEASAKFAVRWAVHAGDWLPIAQHLQNGYELSDELRYVVIAILKGDLKHSNNRPASAQTLTRYSEMNSAVLALEAQGRSTESAVAEVAEMFGRKPRTVYTAMGRRTPRNPDTW